MAAAANAVQAAVVVKGEEWLQGGGGEVSEEKLAFRRAMATRVEKMQFDTSLKPLAMQERIPNSQQQQQLPQQQQQQLKLPQQQILFQWQQQPLPPAFYAGGAAVAAEPWRSRSMVANGAAGAALNQQKGMDGLVAALGQQQQQQQQPGIAVDPQVVSGGMVVPPTTTTMTTSSAPVAPTTGLKKRIACTVLPKGMPLRPLPLHGYIDPFSVPQRPMTTTVRLHHHHQNYHGVTTTSSTTTASGAPHEQQVQSFVQGNKRYKECMDYAHLGCRHFVPCNDPPDPAGGAAEQQQQMLKQRQQGVVSNPARGGVKASLPASAGNWKEIPLARGIGVKLEPGRSFLGHFHIDPQQRSSMAQFVRVGSNNSLSCCRSKVEFDDEQQAKQTVVVGGGGGGGGASSSAVSQVTTAAAVSCVESAESDNNGAMVENLCNASSSPAAGVDCAAAARSDQMNKDATKEEDEDEPSPEVISAAEALDVLAHAAISWGDDELGYTMSRKAVFVHGEIPFVQKRVRRCARPSRLSSQLGKSAVQARSIPERASKRHPSRKRSVDDVEYDDHLGPEAKKPRKNEQSSASSSKQKPKKKSTPKKKKKKPATKKKTTTTETKTKNNKPEVYDDGEDGDGDDEEVVVVSSSSKKRKSCTTTPKRKKLNAVVKRSEEEARQQQQQQQQYEEDDDDVEDDDEDEVEMEIVDEHLAAAMEIQEADEVLGALVRSKRGRNQNLPVRFQGTVMGSWKKGNRKLKPKT